MTDGRFAVVFYQAIGPDVVTAVSSSLAYNDGTWHHAAGVVPYEIGIDAVRIENSLRDVRLDFVGERSDHRVELRWAFFHLDPQATACQHDR